MAAYAEDYLIDDDISASQFSGTLTFAAETSSVQDAADGVEAPGIQILNPFFNFLIWNELCENSIHILYS